jgi:hypothetical protein
MARNRDKSSGDSVFSQDVAEISDEMINEETPEMSETVTEEVTEETPAEVVEENRDPRIQLEDIPSFEEEISPAASGIVHGLIVQVVTFRNSYLDRIETLQAAAFDGSRDNVIEMADKYAERDSMLPGLIDLFMQAEKAYNDALRQLTEQVKYAANIKKLDDKERADYMNEAKELATSVNNAVSAMQRFEGMSGFGTIMPAIEWVKNLPPLPGITKAGATTTRIGSGTSRPRLGKGGYIKFDSMTFENFTKALPVISKKLGRVVQAPELHTAWYDKAQVNDWTKITPDQEITFDFMGVEISILRKVNP